MKKNKDDKLCNLCGLTCYLDFNKDFFGGLKDVKVMGGYESTAGVGECSGALDDFTTYEFSLCEYCLDFIFAKFKVPVKFINRLDYICKTKWKPAEKRVLEDGWRTSKKEFLKEFNKRNKARKIK